MRRLDRRWIFLAIGLTTLVFLIASIRTPLKIDPEVQSMFDAVQSLEAGEKILFAVDYDPGSKPEIEPMHELLLRQLFLKDVRIIAACLWPPGPDLADELFARVVAEVEAETGEEKVYGVDYVNLGFKEGREVVMTSMATSLRMTFPVDKKKTPVDELEILDGVEGLAADPATGERSIAMLVEVSSGYPGTREWLRQVQGRYDVRLVAGVTSVMAPDLYPFYQTRQLEGFLGGVPAAVQYEQLLHEAGLVRELGQMSYNMTIQSAVHVVIIAFIVAGNLLYLIERGRRPS